MKIPLRRYSSNHGFTVIELLTTIAIVGILIGLLVPALGLIRNTAYMVKQKSQFHTIGIGLESYQSDFGDYPDSSFNSLLDSEYCGAQKLAEAMVGWDGYGIHPKTEFMSDGMADIDGDGTPELIYDVVGGITSADDGSTFLETAQENRLARKGPYLELETANAVKLDDIYADVANDVSLNPDTYVLADMFGKVTNRTTKKKTGMPILYYKANTNGIDHEPPTSPPPGGLDNVYEIRDNSLIYSGPAPFTATEIHPLEDPSQEKLFYDRSANPSFPGPPRRPYRSESYILHSAGPDGLYGSVDDVYNFDTEQSGM